MGNGGGVARVRTLEIELENALFRDPLARAFAAAGGLWPSSPPLLPDDEAARRRRLAVSWSVVIRTKFLDDLLQQSSASVIRQVILLGAGMDSRAFRMDWPAGTQLFEVDTAARLGFKASVLRQPAPMGDLQWLRHRRPGPQRHLGGALVREVHQPRPRLLGPLPGLHHYLATQPPSLPAMRMPQKHRIDDPSSTRPLRTPARGNKTPAHATPPRGEHSPESE
nr:SAM-dependent methyltransferase [Streptomyces sp. NRRL B-3648]